MATENPGHPFDEKAALQALEQLHEQIQHARSRREQKLAEFDAFVRSNRAASQAERLAALDELERSMGIQTAARTADRGGDHSRPPGEADTPSWLSEADTPRLEPVHHSYRPDPERDPFAVAPSIWQHRRYQAAAGVAALLLLLVLVVARPWSDSSPEAVSTAASAPAGRNAPLQGSPEVPPAAGKAPTAASERALQIELTTLRPVWMRVTVDGERQVERQVAGGQKLAFAADRAIVVRAGDAGAVRLAIGGADQGLLGSSGQVVNRTLTPDRR